MALRPTAFSIPSTTQLKITFSDNLSEQLSKENFEVESLNAAISNLIIISIEITKNIVLLTTRPHVSGNYYLLKLLDTTDVIFSSEKGSRLLDSPISRELFFVGIDTVNPIRDRMLQNIPSLFDVDNTTLRNIISAQADEMLRAQVAIGRNLSNNYISIPVEDEIRVRGPGATDRLANENAYEITRVSDNLSTSLSKYDKLEYTSDNSYTLLQSIPFFPISLQQVLVEDEEISSNSVGNDFNGFLLSLSKSNVIRVLSITHIRNGETEDCNGNLGTDYDLNIYKYSLTNNKYDQLNAYSFAQLYSNQVLLSEFSNISRPSSLDTIKITYLYKNLGRAIIENSVSVSKIISKINESVPSNAVKFFLDHAPIVDSDNEIYSSKGGVIFHINENSIDTPNEFAVELLFGTSRMPKYIGEYTINYETGEVFVIGTKIGEGTGYNNYVMDYNYRKEFTQDVDFSISDQDVVAHPNRNLIGAEAEITFSYDKVYASGSDYAPLSHIEVINEQVKNKLSGSFSITTQHAPITDIFRIYNQTTGEVYNPLYHSDTEVFFSGNKSPEIVEINSENAKFNRITNEELSVIGKLISPAFNIRITSNPSTNFIAFEPGIPAELISINSDNYFVRTTSSVEGIISTEDIQIRFFGTPDVNNLINSFAISLTATLPSVNSEAIIGISTYQIYLDNEGIINKNLDSIGNLVNTSLSFSDATLFLVEKYFTPINSVSGIDDTSDGGISKALTSLKTTDFYSNLSRLRKVGDYTVDYENGIIYLAVDKDQDIYLGSASYYCYNIKAHNGNVYYASGAVKKVNSPDSIEEASLIYNDLHNDDEFIKILDLESSISIWDGVTEAGDLNGNFQITLEVLSDYSVVVPYDILTILSINQVIDLTGINLDDSDINNRIAESTRSSLLTTISNGGKNLYDPIRMSFSKNVIDLKTSKERRVYADNTGDFTVTIYDNAVDSIYKVTNVTTEIDLFDHKLNIIKLSDVEILNTIQSSPTTGTVYISISDISKIDTNSDFLLDASGNRFSILAIDSILSTLTVESPAINNITAMLPDLDVSGDYTTIVVKPTITITDSYLKIVIPSDAPISSGTLFRITYLTNLIPSVGTALAIDYRYGTIYIDYTYIKDYLTVSYEYGDNTLDWSINDSISEGDVYYVSYNYGAGREALQANFGSLTNIPFFENFPLSVDRELYRSAISGILQTFPKGPTIPAFKSLVKSFTDMNPNIDELTFGRWILGRDYLHVTKPEFTGSLEFRDGRFDDGLLFQPDTTVNIPTISSLSLQEGTLEGWVRPSWSGIDNDADITFEIDNIGDQKYFIDAKDKYKDNDWKIININNIGGLDETGLGSRLFNYNSDASAANGISIGPFLLSKEISHYNVATDSTQKIRIKATQASVRILDDITPITLAPVYSVATFGMLDGIKYIGAELTLKEVFTNISFATGSYIASIDDLPDYDRMHYLRSCSCSVTNNISKLEGFNSTLLKIDLNTSINLSTSLNQFAIVNNSISTFVVIDSVGNCWQVKALEDPSGQLYMSTLMPTVLKTIYLERFPLNRQHVSQDGVDAINALEPSGTFNLYIKSVTASAYNIVNSISAFNYLQFFAIDWSNYIDITIIKSLSENLVSIQVGKQTQSLFYSDLASTTDVSLFGSTHYPNGAIFGCAQSDVYTQVQSYKNRITVHNRYSLSDIHIGHDGYNPISMPFTINREDSPNYAIGLPPTIDTEDGIFIGYDELCKSPLSDQTGQWVFRTRSTRGISIPESVTFIGNTYTSNYTVYEIDHIFSGVITTDGAFSSVVRASRDDIGGCLNSPECSASFRYCGGELLEASGWVNLEETGSTLINTILTGAGTFYEPWSKIGNFSTTESDGIYRMISGSEDECRDEVGNYLFTKLPCGNNIEYITSVRVIDIDLGVITYGVGEFFGAVSGNLVGITPLHISFSYADIKITLALTNSLEPLIVLYDNYDNNIINYVSFNWNDNLYHEYKIIILESTQILRLYVDNLLLSQISLAEFITPIINTESYLAIHVLDGGVVSVDDFISNGLSNTIDVDLIEYTGSSYNGNIQLEDTDIFIHTESKIEFEFHIDQLDGYDAYDAYDAYDGYITPVVGIDEILVSADRAKYFIDSALDDNFGRISVFNDGKGFLNFRIYDESLSLGKEVGMYNLATNIKDWIAGESHHIAISWKLNSIDDKDEMHLFIDGIESPNIYKFGGVIPLKVNAKFSDVSQESLHSFLTHDVDFCNTYTNGIINAGSASFSSVDLIFTDEMIGRSILFTGGTNISSLLNKEYIIKSVTSGVVTFGRGSGLETIIFSASASDIEFKFPPTAGINSSILTDLRNSKFTIYRTLSDGSIQELGGILYEVNGGIIDIISGSNIEDPKYRANLSTRLIEFIGLNSNCDTIATVLMSDVDIHIETMGLNLQRYRDVVDLSASSYITDDSPYDGTSILKLYNIEPLSLSDVEIRRIILDRMVIDIGDIQSRVDGNYLASFSITLDTTSNKVSSAAGRINKQNLGRVVKLWFESDNVVFCETDGYDGYAMENAITIYGITTDGTDEETFSIYKNGYFSGTKFFTTISKIDGAMIIADPNYFELGVVSIKEDDLITVSNNNGDYAEIISYQNGTLTLSTAGSNNSFPFELHKGRYEVEYPSYLHISVPDLGKKLYIGSNYNGEKSWNGVIDEFRIISEMSNDTRTYESETSGTRSITRDYHSSNAFCTDSQTLALIHFDNPIDKQNRRLRNKEFLDEYNNIKFKLSVAQREELLALISDSANFISAMIKMGFNQDQAESTYYETLYAENGPIINEAEYYNNFNETQISYESVNDTFGKSGYFRSDSGLLYNNDLGYFRAQEGTIEFWTSPVLDTKVDTERRYYVDIADIKRERIMSKSSNIIELNNAASEILSVKLLTSAARFESYYTDSELDTILFDEVSRNKISGLLSGGSSVDKDFMTGGKLSANGLTITLAQALPGVNIDMIVTYIPIDSSGDRVSVFKDEYSQIVFSITADGVDNVVTSDVNWKKNTWHRIMCVYKTNTKSADTMKIFVDGQEGDVIRYGTGMVYGTGYIYGQFIQDTGQAASKDYRINLGTEFRVISIGSDIYGDHSARSRIDNLRFSNIMRNTTRDSLGHFIDTNYSSNTDTIYPVIEDDATTFILDFDADGEIVDKFATVIDPKYGIFDFNIDVIDNFNKVIGINDGEIEDLITELVNRLKPAHSNALVKFTKSKC